MEALNDEGSDPRSAVRAWLAGDARLLLAVSGGIDSMVLLHATANAIDRIGIVVATFDHATGPSATRAASLVRRQCAMLGIECISGCSTKRSVRESDWRDERWRFLRSAAGESGRTIVTAHTLDDQVETIFMRILRDAGARGLSGLFAESEVARPFIALRRSDVARYAAKNRVTFVDDPSNRSMRHLRNRVRHDLLPAIVAVRPTFPSELIGVARKAARWRNSMATLADAAGAEAAPNGSLRIARAAVAGYDAEVLRTLWPALAAKANVVMDRRGTHRLAEFTMKGHTGGSIQLSGGIEVCMFRDHLLLRRWDVSRVEAARNARVNRAGLRPVALPSKR